MLDITVAIPTYRREGVLLDTLNQLLALKNRACEILVVDQTTQHQPDTLSALRRLEEDGSIIWRRLDKPSIPEAMNFALLAASQEVVLFLDDDIELTSELVLEHAKEHARPNVVCVAGRVVQLWERELDGQEEAWLKGQREDPDAFRFNSRRPCEIERFMGGNFSVKRRVALEIGGFDENFVKVAYRYEAEFAERLLNAGNVIQFQPAASVVHLKSSTGGTRSFGHHLTSITPAHSVGRYYYLFTATRFPHRFRRLISGPFSVICTKHHLFRPWWIPVTLASEFLGIVWAWWLFWRGPKHVNTRRSN